MQIPKVHSGLVLTLSERFFLERTLELLSSSSIESYRLPLHNPRTLLKELAKVIREYNSSEIPREEYANLLADEASQLFSSETYLEYKSVSLKYFKAIFKTHELDAVFYSATLIVSENTDYANRLFQKINESIESSNQAIHTVPADLAQFDDILKYFLIELREIGYSKNYVYNFFTAIFLSPSAGSFAERITIIGSLINRAKERFEVIIGFVLKPAMSTQLEILDTHLRKIDTSDIQGIIRQTNAKIRQHFSDFPDNSFYRVELESPDYYSASNQVRTNLQLVLDVLYMGYSEEEFTLNPKCIVIGSNNPRRAGIHNLNYQLDGFFKNDQDLYRQFSERISLIRERVAPETLTRIEAALRYLRLGSNIKELENKLLNYWIGMEYFFSSQDSKKNKTHRIREFFKKIHGRIYLKRLLLDFHRNIHLLDLDSLVDGYNIDLHYLIDQANFTVFERNASCPLLAFRASELRRKYFDRRLLIKDLQRHVTKLEWNLVRIYRQRNAIVHSAKSEASVLDTTSHLRYYLLFAINSAVDYLSNSPIDVNQDEKLTLDDFFAISKVEFDNLIADDLTSITSLVNVRNPMEFLT